MSFTMAPGRSAQRMQAQKGKSSVRSATDPIKVEPDVVGRDWMSEMQREIDAGANPSEPSLEPVSEALAQDPFGLDQIAPEGWVKRAAELSAHLHLAVKSEAPAGEVQSRAAELSALLDRAHAGGFDVLLEAAVETATEEPVEPLPAATYADTRPGVIVPLAYPFTIDGERYDQLEIRPPSFALVERVTAGKASEIEMQADMAGVAVDVLRALRWPDAETFITAARHVAPKFTTRRS